MYLYGINTNTIISNIISISISISKCLSELCYYKLPILYTNEGRSFQTNEAIFESSEALLNTIQLFLFSKQNTHNTHNSCYVKARQHTENYKVLQNVGN